MGWLYSWASVMTPFIGMGLSMFSHRYAYMNFSLAVMIVFVFMAYLLKRK